MPRHFRKYSVISRQAILRSLACGVFAIAQLAHATDLATQIKWSYQAGIDIWQLKPSVDMDSQPNFVEENSNLLLPNSHTKLSYRDISAWGRLIGNKQITNDISISAKIRGDQTVGLRADEAQIQKDISPSLIVRAGVVDYKTSWCRSYESTNGWIQEIEAICNTPQFRDVTGGAPGIQILTRQTWADRYAVQTQAGLYKPMFMNYAPQEFGNLIPSSKFQVKKNNKLGLNFNGIDLTNGSEMRLSYIRSEQSAYLPEPELNGNHNLASDLFYIGLGLPLSDQLSFRITHLELHQKSVCISPVAQIGSACNLNLRSRKNSTAIELAYRWRGSHLFSTGLGQTHFDTDQDFFTPTLDVYSTALPFTIDSKQSAIAWRTDWSNNIFTIAQFIRSKQKNTHAGMNYHSHGHALGFRLGYLY